MEDFELESRRTLNIREEQPPTARMQDILATNRPRVEATSIIHGFVHPQFSLKAVCKLDCRHCGTFICHRGMKAILLGDSNVSYLQSSLQDTCTYP